LSTETAYQELGLAPGASDAEVKAAWRRLVSRWHPDRNASRAAVEKMQRINQAFELLRDAAGAMPAAKEQDASTASPSGPRPAAAKPVKRRIKLTLEEAALGCLRVLSGRLTPACVACEGAGLRWPGGDCAGCNGSGQVRERAWYGWMSTTTACADCGGDGRARDTCGTCSGAGKLPPRDYELRVRIPAGVRDGDLLGVPGGANGPPGGLDLQIELLPHAFFRLDDDGTMHCEMPVDGFRWIAGRTVEVPTPGGLKPLALRHGECLYRLPGEGFPASRRGPRGDLWMTVRPVFPPSLSTDQQILLDRLIATSAAAPDGALAAWQQQLAGWVPLGSVPAGRARRRAA
jgi:molecular chaperone DnaJ